VGYTHSVAGKAPVLPPGTEYWLVIQPRKAPQFHPQQGPIVPSPMDGAWLATAYFGESETTNVGETFIVTLVVANQTTVATYRNYLAKAERDRRYPGLSSLMGGVPLVSFPVKRR
jgi:hypothetical protein